MRNLLILAAAALAVAGCSAPAAVSPGSAVAVYPDIPGITAAVTARVRQDATWVSTATLRVVKNGSPVKTVNGESMTRVDPSGVANHISQSQKLAEAARPTQIEITMLPQDTYVRPDRAQWPEPNKPWIRLDPAGGDPVSRTLAPLVALNRQAATRLFCFTELGTATLTGSAPDRLDDTPVQRYVVHVALTADAADAATAKELLDVGVAAIDVAVLVDGLDRVLRCSFAATIPGGTVEGDQRLTAFGDPVEIDAPPADQVLRLPLTS